MIPQEFLDALAVRILEAFLLSLGFQPSGGWDENDPNCLKQHGEHVVWCVCGRSDRPIAEIDVDEAWRSFVEFCHHRNQLPGAVKFEPYTLELYQYPCGCGTYLYAFIYQ